MFGSFFTLAFVGVGAIHHVFIQRRMAAEFLHESPLGKLMFVIELMGICLVYC